MAGEQVAPKDPESDRPSLNTNKDDHPDHRFGEDILLRNFDTETDHRVTVTVTADDAENSEQQFESVYTVEPNETVCEMDVLSTGTYQVIVEMDDNKRSTGTVRIDSHPLNRLLIEIGNGIVSIADGGY